MDQVTLNVAGSRIILVKRTKNAQLVKAWRELKNKMDFFVCVCESELKIFVGN